MPKKKPSQPFAIPPGAAIYGTVTEIFVEGRREIWVHGDGGPRTGIRVKRGVFEKVLPSATILNVGTGPVYVAWDGIGYKLCRALREIQADDNLTLIGSIEGVRAQAPPTAPHGRPPLHPLACEQIDQLLHRVDEQHWPTITGMRVKNYYPPDTPVPPQSPQHLLGQIRWYASILMGTEADQYDQFRKDGRYPAWLSGLAERVLERVLTSLKRLDQGDPDCLLLAYHGVAIPAVESELRTVLWEICQQYQQGIAPSQTKTTPPVMSRSPTSIASAPILSSRKRAPISVRSESAARKLEEYVEANGIGYTEFANRVPTTDRTLRNFRRTGIVKRDVFEGIAKAMGITKETLLKR